MTLQARYDAKTTEAAHLRQQFQQAQQALGQLQQQMIRVDAELALLEELLRPSETSVEPPIALVRKSRKPKAESVA